MTVTFQILMVLGLMACGFGARRRGVLTEAGTSDMSRVLMAVVYPALIIVSMTRLSAPELAANWLMPVMGVFVALVGLLLGLVILRRLKGVSTDTASAFLFQCVFNNYLFLPLPLVMLLWGSEGVSLLVFSSVGSELAIWTLGVMILRGGVTARERVRSLLSPPFCALMLSLFFVLVRDLAGLGLERGAVFSRIIEELRSVLFFGVDVLGQGTIAMSMLVAGSRMATLRKRTMLDGRVWLVAAVRLLLVPALVLCALPYLPLQPVGRGVLSVIAVMPCAMASVVFSERFGGDGEFIAGALLLTHLWALVTVPLYLAWAL